MIGWNNFYIFAVFAAVCWLGASLFPLKKDMSKTRLTLLISLQSIGIVILSVFMIGLSLRLHRPPLRTMGEIRLWYALFLSVVGMITFIRWRYSWVLLFTTLMASVFMVINIVRPEIHNRTLMPVLQSIWFIPHVIIYMFSYALLGCSFIIAVIGLGKRKAQYLLSCDNLVSSGFSLFSIAMFVGAIWAKEAWGHYWTWDAKEIWAAITWMCYLLYLHLRTYKQKKYKFSYIILIFAFIALQMCWYGINYFPSVQENLHAYF